MKYSRFFGLVFRGQGVPQISVVQMQRLMNIVSLEGEIKSLKAVAPKFRSDQKFNMLLWKKQRSLTSLTGNLKAEDLLKEMFRMSND